MMSPSEMQILLAQRIADTLNLDFPKGDYEFTYQDYKNFIDKYKQDYYDVMGVPITFIDKYNPNQFEILGHTSSSDKSPEVEELRTNPKYRNRGLINGKEKYDRVLIRRKKI